MKLVPTSIEGVLLLETARLGDSRGYFSEIFSKKVLPVDFVQDNESFSTRGVVRGLHFQKPPFAQAKLVRCLQGRIVDVAVDIRKGSPTYRRSVCVELSADSNRQLFIPKGFAHGFSVLSETALVQYKCDEFYHPEADAGIQPLDPSLGIDWGLPEAEMLLKEADRLRPLLDDAAPVFFYGETL